MLPALATVEMLSDRCPSPLMPSTSDWARAQAALDDASAKIRGEVLKSWAVLPPGGAWRGAWDWDVNYRLNDVTSDAGTYWKFVKVIPARPWSSVGIDFDYNRQSPSTSGNQDWQALSPTGPFAVDPTVPDVVVTIALAAALRSFVNPESLTGEGIGGYHYTRAQSADVYLTKQEIRLVRRAAGFKPLWTQGTTRGRVETSLWPLDAVLIPQAGGGDAYLGEDPSIMDGGF